MRFLMAILLIGGTFIVASTWDSSQSRSFRARVGKAIRHNDDDKIERVKQSFTDYFSRSEQTLAPAPSRPTPASNGISNLDSQSSQGSRRGFSQRQENPRRRVFLRRPLLRNAQDPQ
ncbi:MAG: hypothetical protein P8N76_09450 [Pirellulaceae bacterium]|nr:hypothetical protein [Pirellulaceae bacterium]